MVETGKLEVGVTIIVKVLDDKTVEEDGDEDEDKDEDEEEEITAGVVATGIEVVDEDDEEVEDESLATEATLDEEDVVDVLEEELAGTADEGILLVVEEELDLAGGVS